MILSLFNFCILIFGLFLAGTILVESTVQGQPTRSLADDMLDFEWVVTDINLPTGLAFLGTNDMLILEQYNGTVVRAKDNRTFPTPVLDVNVANSSERGLLGIEVMQQPSGHPTVFLYYTETQSVDGGAVLGNRLYRYTFIDDANGGKLTNGTLLLDLPATPGREHNGGKVKLGPDGNLYVTIGDVRQKTKTQNFKYGEDPAGNGGILRVTPNGEPVVDPSTEEYILGNDHPLNLYYAYGVRNSFGIDFDPVTGYLWDTENGPTRYDEVNLVQPGFNSGWQHIMGFVRDKKDPRYTQEELLVIVSTRILNAVRGLISENETVVDRNLDVAREQLEQVLPELYDFGRKGKYSDPQFVWEGPVAPTAIQFYNSTVLGENYLNHMFVADFNTGSIYDFALNETRTGLDLPHALSDQIVNSPIEAYPLRIGTGFNGITDIKQGPDGFLYIAERNSGTISRIVPKAINTISDSN
jgi:glucose/arabinose dehydrogenase